MNRKKLNLKIQRRKKRVKFATASNDIERKRLLIVKTNRYLYAQIIDNITGKTIVSAGTFSQMLGFGDTFSKKNKETAIALGKKIAELAKEKNITKVYLDRNGYKYTGRIAAFADAAREAGLQF